MYNSSKKTSVFYFVYVFIILLAFNECLCNKHNNDDKSKSLSEPPTQTTSEDGYHICIKNDVNESLNTIFNDEIDKYIKCRPQSLHENYFVQHGQDTSHSKARNNKHAILYYHTGPDHYTPDALKACYKQTTYKKYSIDNIASYWDNKFQLTEEDVTGVINIYPDEDMPYKSNTTTTAYYTTDFANKSLGGGVLGGGFVQEEQQWLETGLFLLARYKKDKPTTDKTYQLDTNEIAIFHNVPRFFEFKSRDIFNAYNMPGRGPRQFLVDCCDATNQLKENILHQYTNRLPRQTELSSTYNILAIDAPDFNGKAHPTDKKGYTKDELNLLFGKLICAYKACKEQAKKSGQQKVCIITGNLGMGAFKNDPKVVYALNILAALFVNKEQDEVPKIILQAYTFVGASSKKGCEKAIEEIKKCIKMFPDNTFTLQELWDKLDV